MSSVLNITSAAGSDVGQVRESNEDSYFAGDTVYAVADGMGGHQAGEVASEMALRSLQLVDGQNFDDPQDAVAALVRAIEESNEAVVEHSLSDESLRGMGTTLTAVMVHGDQLIAAHVGDSRAYLLRHDEPISQLTTDHTLVERLVREGRLSRDEMHAHPQRNVITRAIGNEPEVTVDALPPLQLQPGDVVLLCSDGLTGPLDDEEIQTLIDATGGGQDAVDALIAAANEAGGPDNITVVVLRVEGGDRGTAANRALDGDPAQTVVTTAGPVNQATPSGDRPTSDRADQPVRQIRTDSYTGADESGDWASTMGRLGAPQGADGAKSQSPGRTRRAIAWALATIVLLGVLAGGSYFLLSRAYFVGESEGQVAAFRGLPETVAGVPLFWVIEDQVSDVEVADLPEFRQADLTEGLPVGTLREARQLINVLRNEAEEGGQDTPADATATETAPTETTTPPPNP